MANDQSSHESENDFKIDIDVIYSDLIKEIDQSRSFINISNKKNQEILNSLTVDNISNIGQLLKPEIKAQESRCHAFFRLIGLPVVSSSYEFYNPGLDIIDNPNRKITQEFKQKVRSYSLTGFRTLSLFRETYLLDSSKIFSLTNSIDASVLALSSGVSSRGYFTTVDKVEQEFDFEKTHQSYKVDFKTPGVVGKRNVSLLEYIDVNGNTPKLGNERYHVIFPHIVDPWIDVSVNPLSSLVAVPFTTDIMHLQINNTQQAKRPLLEKIIKDRYNEASNIDAGEFTKRFSSYITKIQDLSNTNLLRNINEYKTQTDQLNFKLYLSMIQAMNDKLIEAQTLISKAQSAYYWLPIPSNTGPEGGCSIKNITSQFSDKVIDAKLYTSRDQDMIETLVFQTISNVRTNLSTINTTNQTNYTLQIESALDPSSTNAYGTQVAENAETQAAERNQYLSDAGKALRTVEIIKGEFSGLGLCDIIATMGALYIMPREELLGFLDKDAYARAKKELKLTSEENPTTIGQALKSLFNTAKDFYSIMETDYNHKNNKK